MPLPPTMTLLRFIEPATEPLTLAETKLYLRVDHNDEDMLITEMIAAAREAAEQHMHRSLITQQWKLAFDQCLPARIALPMGPVQSVVRISTLDEAMSVSDISSTSYYLNAGKTHLKLTTSVSGHQIEIIYSAGYGDASAVPKAIRQGMLLHIGALYDMRSLSAGLPEAAGALYHPCREVRL